MSTHRLIRCIVLLSYLYFFGFEWSLDAQNTIPPGTIIPVELQNSIDSQKSRVGQAVIARVAQELPLEGRVIRGRIKVLGEITDVKRDSGQAVVGLRFDRIELGHNKIPITTELRAIASFIAIQDAETPTDAPHDMLNSQYGRTTVQIGGDVVYHPSGPVQSRTGEIVGTPICGIAECGVLDRVESTPGPKCAGAVAADTHPQAMWVFSADACGVYGLIGLRFQNGSTISQDGQIAFSSDKRVKLPSGTALLLTVTGTQTRAGR